MCCSLLATAAPVSARPGLWEGSVPGLVLVVPAIEIIVENHDAPGRHSSHDAPEGSRFTDQKTGKHCAAVRVVSLKLELRVGQQNCSPASLSCKATWDSPGFFLGWFLGGIGAG